eukprot:TRINITY_DN2028_c0_g1_i12.p1 TRINITY_DN2028_c0_g1~~TRINITY_DN2028_c0_g1_i12.p1  ORF type:complete len:227 (+),score=22.31 TRINITY_DN2028_c0_g1_i12:477-1157(+)
MQKEHSYRLQNGDMIYLIPNQREEDDSVSQNGNPKKKQKLNEDTNNDGRYALAFPSISTSIYQFNKDKAVEAACSVISDFLKTHKDPELKLYIVDIQDSDLLHKFRERYILKDDRFQVKVADITKLKSQGIQAWHIANSCNEMLSSKGQGINQAIHNACPELEMLSHQRYQLPVEVGIAYPVEIPPSSLLRKLEDVHTVIHILGPNMNPQMPNCLYGDYNLSLIHI